MNFDLLRDLNEEAEQDQLLNTIAQLETMVSEIMKLCEAVEFPDTKRSFYDQLELITQQLDAAKRGLGITNKLPPGEERRKHRSRVMTNLNIIRKRFNQIMNAINDKVIPQGAVNGTYYDKQNPPIN